jgi:hypothetical protein
VEAESGAGLEELRGRLRGEQFLAVLATLDAEDKEAAQEVVEYVVDALLEGATEALADWAVRGYPGRFAFELPSGGHVVVELEGAPGSEVAVFEAVRAER